MTNLISKAFEGHNIRIITDQQGEPWFVAADIAAVLGYAQTNIEGEPPTYILAKIDITCYLVLHFVDYVQAFALTIALYILIPSLTTDIIIVHACRQAVAVEELKALIPRNAHHIVTRIEAICQWNTAVIGGGGVTVIDPMLAPIIEEAQCSPTLVVIVFLN